MYGNVKNINQVIGHARNVRAYSKMEVKNHWDVLAGIDDA
jgi:hypothetical protein